MIKATVLYDYRTVAFMMLFSQQASKHKKALLIKRSARNWNAAATYSPGPSAAKYAGGKRVPGGHFDAAESDPQAASETSRATGRALCDD